MAGYVIAIIDVIDPERYSEYSSRVPETIARYGGRFLVRGGRTEVREGEWPGTRTVILEFPSMQRALEWYDSPDYRAILPIRQAHSRGRLAFFESAPSPLG